MNNEIEYEKRISIVNQIKEEIKDYVEAIIVGGSVGLKNVVETSDIDIVVVADKHDINRLIDSKWFRDKYSSFALKLLNDDKINMFRVVREINGIEVNFFIYEKNGFVNYCLIKGSRIAYTSIKPKDTHYGYGFNGEKLFFNRAVNKIGEGYVYIHPVKINGKYYGLAPRLDLIIFDKPTYQKNEFFNKLKNQTWISTIKCLIEENKELDLKRTNVLNTIWNYHEKKHGFSLLTEELKNKITERTKLELKNLQ